MDHRGAPAGPAAAAALGLVVVLGAGAGCASPPAPGDPSLRIEWPSYGGDPGGLKYSPAAELTPDNVAALRPLWSWRVGDPSPRRGDDAVQVEAGSFQATPLMVGDTLYLSTPYAGAVALHAATGREIWRHDPGAWRWPHPGGRPGFVHRGVALWTGDGGRRVLLHSRWRLLALDAATGRPVPGFGVDGVVDLTTGLRWPVDFRHLTGTSPPAVYRDVVIVGSAVSDNLVFPRDPPGDVQAFDARTGRRLWRWDPVPAVGQPGAESWDSAGRATAGHLNVWAPMTVDTARGLVFLPVSTPSNDYYGGNRPGANLYAESLVCLEAATGRLVWHQQLVHHGLWDYDPAAPPNLATITRDGRPRDIVTLPGKTGYLYVFDRVTGEPVWPVEERPVPASDVPGEQAWPTQPVPSWPAPFARQGFGLEDLVDFTPELRRLAEAKVSGYRLGPIFTPPSLQGTVVMPGWIGGAGWGGGAIDPVAGVIYIKATNLPVLGRLVPAAGGDQAPEAGYTLDFSVAPAAALELSLPGRRSRRPPFRRSRVPVPISKPPYGTLTAIDLATGEHRWQVTLGDLPEVRGLAALQHLDLPPLGTPGPAGGVATGGGLIFITGGGTTLFAVDSRDGSTRWSWDLGGTAKSNPMTYRMADGRQVVVTAVGDGADSRLMAFALPRSGSP